MVRNLLGLSKSTMVTLRGLKKEHVGRRFMRGKNGIDSAAAEEEVIPPGGKEVGCESNKTKNIEECEWVPHDRSGIYFPKGHEWVMEDVPTTAASDAPTYWLRVDHDVDP